MSIRADKTTTLLLSQSHTEQCLDMMEVIEVVEATFKAYSERRVAMPSKITLDMSSVGLPNWINAMPAYVEPVEMCGIKWAGGFVNNPSDYHLPFLMAILMLNDPQTGVTVAIMDAAHITAMRTGASAAVAARYLARSNSSVAAIVGCGVQGLRSLQALSLVFKLDEVFVTDIKPQARESFRRRAGELGIDVCDVDETQRAVAAADLIVTATTANEPLVFADWLKPGAFIATLGSFQELDDALILGADKLIVDHRGQAEHRGELGHLFDEGRITQNDIYAELSEIVVGILPARENDTEVIVAVPVGMAAMDVAVGALVLRRAQELGLGQCFDFLA